MFSKQHHEAIADAIRKAREHVRENSDVSWHAGELSNAIMREFADLLEADSLSFDRARFNSRVFIGRLDHELDCISLPPNGQYVHDAGVCKDWEDEHVEPVPVL